MNFKLEILSFLVISPDLLSFSRMQKLCILTELTHQCEENMDNWHNKFSFKYDPLCAQIKANRWSPQFFAIKVGKTRYCSNSVKFCFSRLGFPGLFMKTTLGRNVNYHISVKTTPRYCILRLAINTMWSKILGMPE